jgi:hypothetical protein
VIRLKEVRVGCYIHLQWKTKRAASDSQSTLSKILSVMSREALLRKREIPGKQ